MSNEFEAHESSSDTIDSSLRQEPDMDSQGNESSTIELLLRSVDERIKEAIDLILRRLSELCALLASRTELEPTVNNEEFGSRRDNTCTSPSCNRYDSHCKS